METYVVHWNGQSMPERPPFGGLRAMLQGFADYGRSLLDVILHG